MPYYIFDSGAEAPFFDEDIISFLLDYTKDSSQQDNNFHNQKKLEISH